MLDDIIRQLKILRARIGYFDDYPSLEQVDAINDILLLVEQLDDIELVGYYDELRDVLQ